jgi:O-succinylbenzoate synthase
MKLKQIQLCPYEFTYVHGYKRSGALLKIESESGESGVGDVAPLIERSKETLTQSIDQFRKNQALLISIEWDKNHFLTQIANLQLFPSLAFAIESALFSIFERDSSYTLDVAAMLTGSSAKQIIDIAEVRKNEGFTTAKLKSGNLSLEEVFTANGR